MYKGRHTVNDVVTPLAEGEPTWRNKLNNVLTAAEELDRNRRILLACQQSGQNVLISKQVRRSLRPILPLSRPVSLILEKRYPTPEKVCVIGGRSQHTRIDREGERTPNAQSP